MKLDLVNLLTLVMFIMCTISIGYTVLRCLKGHFVYTYKNIYKTYRIKSLDYNIYLDISDYFTYEKYQIWRFYFPA